MVGEYVENINHLLLLSVKIVHKIAIDSISNNFRPKLFFITTSIRFVSLATILDPIFIPLFVRFSFIPLLRLDNTSLSLFLRTINFSNETSNIIRFIDCIKSFGNIDLRTASTIHGFLFVCLYL